MLQLLMIPHLMPTMCKISLYLVLTVQLPSNLQKSRCLWQSSCLFLLNHIKHLFDVPTRMRSNVAGHGKEKLDPEIIKYIKTKVFEYYECNPSEIKKEWARCETAIDENSRALRKLKGTKSEN